jgi:hypothetical protein
MACGNEAFEGLSMQRRANDEAGSSREFRRI